MRIRWIMLVVGLSLGALALSLLPLCSHPLSAQAGCCKVRPSASAPWSKRPDLTLAACRDLNAQRDKDDLFEEQGLVWWDRACR